MWHPQGRTLRPAHLLMAALAVVSYGIAGSSAQAISAGFQQLFDFGSVGIGSSSDPRTITLINFGNDATLLALAIKAKPGSPENQFTITGGTCNFPQGPLQTTKTCTVIVTANPTVSGTVEGLVTVTAMTDIDGTFISQPVTITAKGVAPQLIMAPALNFGNVPVGTTSPPQTVLVINSGTIPAILGGGEVFVQVAPGTTNQFTATGGTCFRGPTLAPGATCTYVITAIPTVPGISTQTFVLTGKAGSGFAPVTNPLTVNGLVPTLPASPAPSPSPASSPAPIPSVNPTTISNPISTSTPSPSPSPSPMRHHRHNSGK